ncbi:hypothetical protein IS481_14805 [Caldimonas thermodepolymerans]|uniref:HAD domain-containing protein n=1 Tax=Caldimonas thermodepolymerans TaxID=215580 RepID=UPI0011AFE538|nr:HAD domain-containing protein [Caldimonas thermodepolymerans]QPC30992.1 hypothetical protein IS481_14805 [Caldimonas thermodepolymerans]
MVLRPRFALYLDFDGVLHPHPVLATSHGPRLGAEHRAAGHTLFEHAHLLADALEAFPFVDIVLSTTWAQSRSFTYAKKKLPQRLQHRVIGSTFHSKYTSADDFSAMPRGLQVWADVLRREPLHWVALDDDAFSWPTWCRDKLVRTDSTLGLATQGAVDALTRHLRTAEDALRTE